MMQKGTSDRGQRDYEMPPLISDELISIPAAIIRGGTSKGVYLDARDLPADRSHWGPFLIALFGATNLRQIDGIGGAAPTTSKCCIVAPSDLAGVDVDYTFAQVGIGEDRVFWDFNCGNLTPAVATFAILRGFVTPVSGMTRVVINQTNTRTRMTVDIPTSPTGAPLVEGNLEIAGVDGTGAGAMTDLSEAIGASLGGELFPTGHRSHVLNIEGLGHVECSILDLANMCVFFRAADVGLTGYELVEQGPDVVDRFIAVRKAAQALLGLDETRTTPWPVCISAARDFTTRAGRYVRADEYDFTVRFAGIQPMRDTMHEAFPGTASTCTAVSALVSGTVTNGAMKLRPEAGRVRFAHPSGVMEVEAAVQETEGGVVVRRASFGRTVRLIMDGHAYVSAARLSELVRSIPSDAPTRASVSAAGVPQLA